MKAITKNKLLIIIILIGSFLRLYKLKETMHFIADQGWFYISARDLIVSHIVPLVGITSSHTWLHQGALWTYILAILFKLTNFNPFIPAYFTAILDISTIFLVYFLGKELFSKRVGLLSSFFYAISPGVILDARLSYHTSPIPFFTSILVLFIYRFLNGNKKYFPFIILILAILYNFEIATFSFDIAFIFFLFLGLITKQKWATNILDLKILLKSIVAFAVPMIPMFFYDLHHGFPQTVKVVVWSVYKVAVLFGYPTVNPNFKGGESWTTWATFLSELIRRIIFYSSFKVSLLIFFIVLFFIFYKTVIAIKNREKKLNLYLISICFLVPALGYISAKTNSAAYLLIFYPTFAIIIGYFWENVFRIGILKFILIILLVYLGFSNAKNLIKYEYIYPNSIQERIDISKKIISLSKNNKYNILGRGKASKYISFVTPYEYLTWWLGKGPSNTTQKTRFYVSEYPDKIIVETK